MALKRAVHKDTFYIYDSSTSQKDAQYAYGSWELFRDLEAVHPDELGMILIEVFRGIYYSMAYESSERGYLSRELHPDIQNRLDEVITKVHALNELFFHKTNPSPILQITAAAEAPFSQAVENILKQGARFLPDMNSQAISKFISPQSLEATYNLNDKRYFTEKLEEAGLQVPETISLSLSLEEAEKIVRSSDLELQSIIDREPFSDIFNGAKYFLKISAEAGGDGVLSMPNQNYNQIRKFFQTYVKAHQSNPTMTLIASKAIPKSRNFTEIDVLADRIPYVPSPCLTMAITSNSFTYGQVAAQVLKDGTVFVGSLWDQETDSNFYLQQSSNIDKLVQVARSAGFEGLCGTDYILSTDQTYRLIADGNFRANGSHFLLFLRKALQNYGHTVTRAFQSVTNLDVQSLQDLQEFTLRQNQSGKLTGAIIAPKFTEDFATGSTDQIQVQTAYINPQIDPLLFEKFQNLNS